MKRIRFAIIILAAVLIAAGGIFAAAFYFNDKAEKEAKANEDKLILFDFDANAVDKVEITNESGQYVSEYVSGEGWQLSNSDEFELKDTAISAITTNMASLKAVKTLDDKDKSKYGFDNAIKVTSYIGDTAYTLLIGDATPTYENFYVMKENDDNIYLIDYANGVVLDATKDALKQTFIYVYKSYDINHIALWEGKQTDENIRFALDKDANDTWKMSKPVKDSDVNLTHIDEFLTDSAKDQIYNFVQEGCTEADYSKYGFDNPQFVFEIATDEKSKTIIFGNEVNEEEMYGLFVESGQVVTFMSNEISLLNYKTLDIMNTTIFSADIESVSEVTVTLNGTENVLDMSEGKDAYKFNDKNVCDMGDDAKNAFISFYNSFNNAYFESEEKDTSPTGDSEITIKYALDDGIVIIIDYVPVEGEDSYYVLKNGEYTGFAVDSAIIEFISNAYEALNNTIK